MNFIEKVDRNKYTNFVENHPTKSHFLQSVEWGEVSKIRGLIPHYIGLEDNGKLCATALLLQKKLPMGFSYFYIPRGFVLDYKNEDLVLEFTKQIDRYTKKYKSIFFRIDPDIKRHNIDKSAKPIDDGKNEYKLIEYLSSIGYKRKKDTFHFETMQPRYTFRIDLMPSIEDIEKKYSSTTKQRIKKAEKYGIEVFEGGKDNLNIFCDLMKKTEIVKGFYSHDNNFYEKFFDEFAKNKHVDLYIGKIDLNKVIKVLEDDIKEIDNNLSNDDLDENKKNELVKRKDKLTNEIKEYENREDKIVYASSYLTVHYGDKCWALYAGNHPEFKNLFANYIVYKYQIRNSKKLGAKIFDVFGTIGDPDNESSYLGLHEFKKKFGGDYTEFIGEFDFIQNKLMYFMYEKVIPLRHKIVNRKLKKEM